MTDLEVYMSFAIFGLLLWAGGASLLLLDMRENYMIATEKLKRLQQLRALDRENFRRYKDEVEELRDKGVL